MGPAESRCPSSCDLTDEQQPENKHGFDRVKDELHLRSSGREGQTELLTGQRRLGGILSKYINT